MANFLKFFTFSSKNRVDFDQRFVKTLWTIYYWPLGKQLLNAISQKASGLLTDQKCDVIFHPGAANYKEFLNFGCSFMESGKLYLDFSYFQGPEKFEPSQNYVIQCKKTYAYVFHELLHFYHDLLGEFQSKGNLDEEFRTVGLYQYQHEKFSENSFRKQLNLPRRPCYVWKKTQKNLAMYQMEKKLRAIRKLPEQSTLTSSSPECRFRATGKAVSR